jgi:hypothetical protein
MPIFNSARSRGVIVLAAAAVLAVGAGSGAVAGSLITGKDIKNRSIEAQDLAAGAVTGNKLENGSIKLNDLSEGLAGKIGETGAAGAQGPKGEQGPQGPKGDAGSVTYSGANWSIIDRNVIGNGDSYLRSGPSVGTDIKPPMGIGSLGIRTGSPEDKASFGNQVDFVGKTLASISTVSFWEFTTGENRAKYVDNAASVSMEINPNKYNSGYSTLNYVVRNLPVNTWTKVETTDAGWYLTGAAGTGSGCNQVTYCTLAQVKEAMPDATLFTVQLGKGRDYAFSGAIDALQINSTTYDFEPFGVIEKTS